MVKEYIERVAVRNALYDADAITMLGVKMLNQYPAADVVEVRHGKWKYDDFDGDGFDYQCTICKQYSKRDYNYCPSCGAVMDGGQDDA